MTTAELRARTDDAQEANYQFDISWKVNESIQLIPSSLTLVSNTDGEDFEGQLILDAAVETAFDVWQIRVIGEMETQSVTEHNSASVKVWVSLRPTVAMTGRQLAGELQIDLVVGNAEDPKTLRIPLILIRISGAGHAASQDLDNDNDVGACRPFEWQHQYALLWKIHGRPQWRTC